MPMNPVACQGKFEEFFNGVNWPIPAPSSIADAHLITASKWEEALVGLNTPMDPTIALYVPVHAAAFKATVAINSLLLISSLTAYASDLASSMIGATYNSATPGPVIVASPPPQIFVFPPAAINNTTLVATIIATALYDWMKTGTFIYLAFSIIPIPGNWQ